MHSLTAKIQKLYQPWMALFCCQTKADHQLSTTINILFQHKKAALTIKAHSNCNSKEQHPQSKKKMFLLPKLGLLFSGIEYTKHIKLEAERTTLNYVFVSLKCFNLNYLLFSHLWLPVVAKSN